MGDIIVCSLFVYILFVLIINTILHHSTHIKIPYFKKRYVGNKSPIYKLKYDDWDDCYRVNKYILDWTKLNKYNELRSINHLIPFASAFCSYGYVRQESQIGTFSKSDILKEGFITSIGGLENFYEDAIRKSKEEIEEYLSEEEIFNNKITNINREFNENYVSRR